MKRTARYAYALASLVLAQLATAQEYPAAPVRMVVGFPPGGPADVFARITAQKIGAYLNANVIVDTRSGANGNIAADFVAKPDAGAYERFFAQHQVEPRRAALFEDIERNLIVPHRRNVPEWRRYLEEAGAQDVTVDVFARSGHALLLQAAGATHDINAGKQFAPGVLSTLTGWIRSRAGLDPVA